MSVKEKKYFKISIVVAFVLVLLIVVLNPILSDVTLLPDQGSSWYYWKLPTRNSFVMLIVWGLFLVHLGGNFILIRKRLKSQDRVFNKYNFYLLMYNFTFVILHFVQTIFLYDGLAQDVPIWTSQYSVIFILIVLIVMQMNQRGVILGYKVNLSPQTTKFLFKWHGILFTTAIIYTFWYHPIVLTVGHLTGFLYIFLLLIQVSFLKTKVHYNKTWILVLEVLVAFHGASVAYFVQSSTLWSMFLFGFLFIFFMTQIYTLKIEKKYINILQVLFFTVAIGYYLYYDITKIHQILWIPTIEYLGVLIFIAISVLVSKLKKDKSKGVR